MAIFDKSPSALASELAKHQDRRDREVAKHRERITDSHNRFAERRFKVIDKGVKRLTELNDLKGEIETEIEDQFKVVEQARKAA